MARWMDHGGGGRGSGEEEGQSVTVSPSRPGPLWTHGPPASLALPISAPLRSAVRSEIAWCRWSFEHNGMRATISSPSSPFDSPTSLTDVARRERSDLPLITRRLLNPLTLYSLPRETFSNVGRLHRGDCDQRHVCADRRTAPPAAKGHPNNVATGNELAGTGHRPIPKRARISRAEWRSKWGRGDLFAGRGDI